MAQRILVFVLAVAAAAAVPPVRTMYNDALAREQAVRAALAAPDALATILIDIRAVVASYESVVKHYPASGYSDDALWNAGRLELDAYARFGQASDKDTAARLLKKLAATYPTSKFAKQVPDQLGRIDTPASVVASPSKDERASTVVTIRDIHRTVTPQLVRVTIELDGEATFHDERIADPERVFLDLSGTRAAPPLVDKTLRFDADADVVRQIRIGRHPNNTTRVVLDAAGVGSYSVYPMTAPYRLVIDCVRSQDVKLSPAPAAEAVRPRLLASHVLTRDWVKAYPQGSPRASARIANARASMLALAAATPLRPSEPTPTAMTMAPAAPTTPTATVVTPPDRNATGGFSMARQLGLGVSRIVIDPGHGGHDPGAKGRGVTEAELVLDVSQRLKKLLEKAGIEVILTRTGDEFVPLQERPQIANREGADLFLSIHANASPTGSAHGVETYFLNFANNPNAAQVAA